MPEVASVPILTCAESKAWEDFLLGTDEAVIWPIMQRAGQQVAAAILEDFTELGGLPDEPQLLVLGGKGHNGGDALLAAAEILAVRPKAAVTVVLSAPVRSLRPLADRALRSLVRAGPDRVTVRTWSARVVQELRTRSFTIGIDGLLGMSFTPPMKAPIDAMIAFGNEAGIAFRAAVDLPSGLGDATKPEDMILRADATYATGIAKAPALDPRFRAATGRVRFGDLGFFAREAEIDRVLGVRARARLLTADVLAPMRSLRSATSDKRSFGHVLCLGGSEAMPGSITMTVRAALQAGAGLVTAGVPASIVASCAAAIPEAMWVPLPTDDDGFLAPEGFVKLAAVLPRASALVAGPGMGNTEGTRRLLRQVLTGTELPAVLDSDALQPDVILAAKSSTRSLVLTPHAGEFLRMADSGVALPLSDEVLREYAGRIAATIVLKGPVTRISDGHDVYHATAGGPVQARGGSGDLLAGVVGARLGIPAANALGAAAEGTLWLGQAAEKLARKQGAHGVRTTEILPWLGEVARGR